MLRFKSFFNISNAKETYKLLLNYIISKQTLIKYKIRLYHGENERRKRKKETISRCADIREAHAKIFIPGKVFKLGYRKT